jgi:hypothetical protein
MGSETAWYPHVYVMLCEVNQRQVDVISDVRNPFLWDEPLWLSALRGTIHSGSWAHAAQLRSRLFVKVGSTYGLDRDKRTNSLIDGIGPSTTMTCLGVPVRGAGPVTHIAGERELELALHRRWAADRIDPAREFFWLNHEIAELLKLGEPKVFRSEFDRGVSVDGAYHCLGCGQPLTGDDRQCGACAA